MLRMGPGYPEWLCDGCGRVLANNDIATQIHQVRLPRVSYLLYLRKVPNLQVQPTYCCIVKSGRCAAKLEEHLDDLSQGRVEYRVSP